MTAPLKRIRLDLNPSGPVLLPRDLENSSLSFLPHSDCPAVAGTCRFWRNFGRNCLGSREIVSLFFLKMKEVTEPLAKQLMRSYPNLRRLNLSNIVARNLFDECSPFLYHAQPDLYQKSLEELYRIFNLLPITHLKPPSDFSVEDHQKLVSSFKNSKLRILDYTCIGSFPACVNKKEFSFLDLLPMLPKMLSVVEVRFKIKNTLFPQGLLAEKFPNLQVLRIQSVYVTREICISKKMLDTQLPKGITTLDLQGITLS